MMKTSELKNITGIMLAALIMAGCGEPPRNANREANAPAAANTREDRPANAREDNAGSSVSPKIDNSAGPARSNTSNAAPAASNSTPTEDAAAVVRAYYAAINRRDYQKAYLLWADRGAASKQTLKEFRDGFADTALVEIKTSLPGREEGAAGSQYITVPLTIEAKTDKGAIRKFAGEYVLRRSTVDDATAEQRDWRIYSADIKAQ